MHYNLNCSKYQGSTRWILLRDCRQRCYDCYDKQMLLLPTYQIQESFYKMRDTVVSSSVLDNKEV